MTLSKTAFLAAIENFPIAAFDLIIKNPADLLLLGLRKNPPAKDYWFVPGQRILKDETLENAFLRITENELGEAHKLGEGKFLGVFQHFYRENFAERAGISTHYIVFGIEMRLNIDILQLPLTQHQQWKWWELGALQSHAKVHLYTKAYFDIKPVSKVF